MKIIMTIAYNFFTATRMQNKGINKESRAIYLLINSLTQITRCQLLGFLQTPIP